MTIVEMLVRGAALEPMFCGQGPDIRGRSNAGVIQAAMDYVQATGGASSFSIEIVNKKCGHAVLLPITKSAIRKGRWLADVRRYSELGAPGRDRCPRGWTARGDGLSRLRQVRLFAGGNRVRGRRT
jgi:hypothetical protein